MFSDCLVYVQFMFCIEGVPCDIQYLSTSLGCQRKFFLLLGLLSKGFLYELLHYCVSFT